MHLLSSLICLAMVSSTFGFRYEDDAEKENLRVQGGYRPENLEQFGKYIVSIRLKREEKKLYGSGHVCGGTIIADKAVLTAAHCVVNFKKGGYVKVRASKFVIVAGSPNRLQKGKYARSYDVDKIIRHEDFVLQKLRNDIAIIKVKENFEFNDFTQKAPPLANWQPTEDVKCTVVGFGRIFDHGPMPNKIFYADLLIWRPERCQSASSYYVASSMLCALSSQMEGISACKGDSGGPLFCAGANVSGIVSFGEGCGGKFKPGYYTKVYAFRDWIIENGSSDLKGRVKEIFWRILFLEIFIIYGSKLL